MTVIRARLTGRALQCGALKTINIGDRGGRAADPQWGFAGVVGHKLAKPLVAAVNGLAFSGGLEIMLACDLAVMSASRSRSSATMSAAHRHPTSQASLRFSQRLSLDHLVLE